MIDSIAVDLPFPHYWPMFGGANWTEDADGQVVFRKDRHLRLEGSFDATTMVKTVFSTQAEADAWNAMRFRRLNTNEYHYRGRSVAFMADGSWRNWGTFGHELRTLRLEGSSAKFLQGHNLFGTDNLVPLVCAWAVAVLESIGLSVSKETLARWERGDMKFHRVDVARMADVGGDQGVADVLAALTYQATYINRGRGIAYGTGLRWGCKSTRRTVVKAYDKYKEIHAGPKHAIPQTLEHAEWLKQYARGCVRFEVEFHSKELDQLGLRYGDAWHPDVAERIYEDAMSKLKISGQMPVTDERYAALPRHLQATYDKWLAGRDVRASFRTKQNFYQHRNAMLSAIGIDIAMPYSDDYRPKVVSLSKVIQPVPKAVPQWAYGTSLLAAA